MKVLVTGASGFLGYHLVRHLENRHDVIGTYHAHPARFARATAARLDLIDLESCRTLILQHRPDAIIHAAAMTLTGECEKDPEAARRTNVDGTRNLLEAARALSTSPHTNAPPYFAFLSTDLVFDGRRPGGMYDESAEPNPLMVYGRTKADAERVLQEQSKIPAGIFRSALIYGPPTAPRPCFLDWMIQHIRAGTGTLFTDEFRSPVYVEDLCTALEHACELRATGLFHLGGPERISRYDFGLLVANTFGFPPENVKAARSADVPTITPRPADVSMAIAKARQRLNVSPTSCGTALQTIRDSGFYA